MRILKRGLARHIPARPPAKQEARAALSLLGRASMVQALGRMAWISFGVAVFFVPFRYRWTLFERPLPPVYGDYTNGLIFLSDIFLLLAIVSWLAQRALQRKRIDFGPPLLALPLTGLLLTGMISVLVSVAPLLSFYHLARLLLLAGLYLFLANELRDLRPLTLPLASGVFIQAVVGVSQWLTQRDVGLQHLGEYELDPAWNGVSIVWAAAGRSLRAYGLSDHPNILGGMLAFSLIVLFVSLVERQTLSEDWSPRGQRGNWGEALPHRSSGGNLPTTAVFLLGISALLVTFSRSAWLAFGAGLVFTFGAFAYVRRGDLFRHGSSLLLAGLIVLAPLVWRSLPYLGVRLNLNRSFEEVPYERGSLGERAVLNHAANQIFVAHGLTGVGLGSFPVALRLAQPDYPFNYQPPHLVILEAAAETGLLGALSYALAMTAPWVILLLRRKRLAWTPGLVAAGGLLLAVGVVGLFDYYPWLLAPGKTWQWLAWGVFAAMVRRAALSSEEGSAGDA